MFNIITWKRSHEATYFTASHAMASNAFKALNLKSEFRQFYNLPSCFSRHFTHVLALRCSYNIFATIISYLITRTKRLRKKKTITNECMRDKNTSFHYIPDASLFMALYCIFVLYLYYTLEV